MREEKGRKKREEVRGGDPNWRHTQTKLGGDLGARDGPIELGGSRGREIDIDLRRKTNLPHTHIYTLQSRASSSPTSTHTRDKKEPAQTLFNSEEGTTQRERENTQFVKEIASERKNKRVRRKNKHELNYYRTLPRASTPKNSLHQAPGSGRREMKSAAQKTQSPPLIADLLDL